MQNALKTVRPSSRWLLRAAFAGFMALLGGGCSLLGGQADCLGGTKQCGSDGVLQECAGGEGYYYWSDRPCDGLEPVCVSDYSPGAHCEDHANPPPCPPGVESLPGVVPPDWSPKGVADIDGDGVADVLFVGEDRVLRIVRGIGGGSFASPTEIPAAAAGSLTDVRAADVDGDGHLDLVLSSASPSVLSVLTGKGDGTFAPGPAYAVGTTFVLDAVADMDGDGRDDVVATTTLAARIDVLSHFTDSGFVDAGIDLSDPGREVGVESASAAAFVRSGPLALVAYLAYSGVEVLLPKSGGGYRPGTEIASGFTVADLDNDGLADVIGRSLDPTASPQTILSSLSVGDGTFRAAKGRAIPAGLGFITVADVDGDHRADLVGLYDPSFLTVFKGRGDGTFADPTSFTVEADDRFSWRLAADFDNDGRQDILVRSDLGALVVLRGACTVP